MSRSISDFQKQRILKCHAEGMTRNEIAERMGLHPKTVQYAISGRPKRKSFADEATGSVENKGAEAVHASGCLCPRCISSALDGRRRWAPKDGEVIEEAPLPASRPSPAWKRRRSGA